jgi:hypothetical protein
MWIPLTNSHNSVRFSQYSQFKSSLPESELTNFPLVAGWHQNSSVTKGDFVTSQTFYRDLARATLFGALWFITISIAGAGDLAIVRAVRGVACALVSLAAFQLSGKKP